MTSTSLFPPDFLWGAATSAYQIEGSPLVDGAGASNWYRFAHIPGKIADGTNGDLACDHYRRFADDVALMRELGLQAYRFSTSWARVLPEGTGRANDAGLDFYSRLVDTLLDHQIQPMLTLFHWDLPAVLEDQGGWTNSASVDWFTEYATLMVRKLGDRVPQWVTLNEPWVVFDAGYIQGQHPPGRRDWAAATLAAKHLLLAHGAAINAFRSESNQQIGLVVNLVPVHAASEMRADQLAANRFDAYLNRQFLDPALLGQIPNELPEMFGDAWPQWTTDELQQVCQPLDFVGVNYYLRLVVCDDTTEGPMRARIVPQPDCRHTAMGWEIYPRGLTQTLQWVNERYGDVSLYITENGAAFDDRVEPNGSVVDLQRVEYLREHLGAAKDAIAAGVNLCGYFAWSLLDNFEWQFGFSKRFGIVYTDFETQRRLPKASARFYSDVIRTKGAVLQV